MTALISVSPSTLGRVYAGQWIADCPLCSSASVLRFGSPAWDCQDCGTELEVRWPPEETRRGIERLLSMRPISHTRNWFPGETLHDLLAENVTHAIGPAEEGQELLIVGDEIVKDTLPAAPQRQQIGA